MILSFSPRILVAALLTGVLSLAAAAQTTTPNTTEWDSEALNLRLFYPSDLDQSDAAHVMRDGHFTLFGISGAADPKLAEATRCLRPLLLLRRPQSGPPQTTSTQATPDGGTHVTITPTTTATILLAELDVNCLSEQQSKSTNLLADMAEIVTKVPGMKPIAQPSWYTIGYQKVHMAAAQGQPQPEPQPQPDAADQQPVAPFQLYTMGISTNWNSHLLVWYFSSNSIDTLNRLTKTTVRFRRAQPEPLYPLTIGNISR
jgi:hypothetical protein